jgi:Zn-dependent peptidase ImmA (M78 family)
LAIAILMPEKYFRERFSALKTQLSAAHTVKDLDELTIDMLSKEFAVTFNACASRCGKLNISKGKIKKKELPGAVTF